MSSTRTLVALLRPWIRRFTIIISAWWLRTSSKFTWEEVKMSTGKLGKWSTPKRVWIRPKYSAPSLSRDRRIKMHQSINQVPKFSLNNCAQSSKKTFMCPKFRTNPVLKYTHCHISTNLSNFPKLCLLYCQKLFVLAPPNCRFAEKNRLSGNNVLCD